MRNFSRLPLFCEHVDRKYGGLEGVTEDQLAEEFRAIYLKGLPLGLQTLKAVAASCGYELKGLEKMPANMRGYHEVYGDNKTIYFRNGDTSSGIQNTILHELRELMEKHFAEVNPGHVPLRTNARHIAANKFASAVLLPAESFRGKVYQTGLDIFALSMIYSKSCSQVLLRMGEVLQDRLFFYAALYEPDAGNGNVLKVKYWTVSYNNNDLDANFRGVENFFPRKGKPVKPDSLADMAITNKKAYLVRQMTLFDNMADTGLTAIAKPFMEQDTGVIRLAQVVMLAHDAHLLGPQIERAKPITIDNFHKHL